VTTAVVALPLALAFAIASGVDARYGLYTAIVTGIVAAVFGGSKVQISGPTGGMAAVLIAVTTRYGYEKVVLIALIAGLFQITAGFLRLGRFVKMLPFPLIAGFTMGIGLVIFGGQLDNALGIQIHHQHSEFLDRMIETGGAALRGGISPASLGISIGTILMVLGINRINSRMPAALISLILASFAVWALGLDVRCVKDIPQHLPFPHFPEFSWEMFRGLLRPGATVAALGAIESLLAAVVADGILGDGSRHDSNRELVGQGLANIASSFFGGIPCTGAIARTAVNIKSGGRSRLAAIVHSVFLLAVMFFLAPMATHIPIAALAGILMVTAVRMVEWRDVGWLMTAPRSDITVMGITVFVTVFTDLVMAVEFGLAAAALIFIKKMSEVAPQIVPADARDEAIISGNHVRIFRIPGPLFWGDSHAILEVLQEIEDVKVVILKMQLVTHIDASGVSTLREARNLLKKRGIKLYLVNVPHRTLEVMAKMGFTSEIRDENIFATLESAKAAAVAVAATA
jgi:SulP family sulfate permease